MWSLSEANRICKFDKTLTPEYREKFSDWVLKCNECGCEGGSYMNCNHKYNCSNYYNRRFNIDMEFSHSCYSRAYIVLKKSVDELCSNKKHQLKRDRDEENEEEQNFKQQKSSHLQSKKRALDEIQIQEHWKRGRIDFPEEFEYDDPNDGGKRCRDVREVDRNMRSTKVRA